MDWNKEVRGSLMINRRGFLKSFAVAPVALAASAMTTSAAMPDEFGRYPQITMADIEQVVERETQRLFGDKWKPMQLEEEVAKVASQRMMDMIGEL